MTQGIFRPTFCSACGQHKPISHFQRYTGPDGKQHPHSECKACRPKRELIKQVCDSCGVEKVRLTNFNSSRGKYKTVCKSCYAGSQKVERTCSICKQTKSLVENFTRVHKGTGRYDACRECRAPIVQEERVKKLTEILEAKRFLREQASPQAKVHVDTATNPFDWRNYKRQIHWHQLK